MSLIQEALKRQQEDASTPDTAAAPRPRPTRRSTSVSSAPPAVPASETPPPPPLPATPPSSPESPDASAATAMGTVPDAHVSHAWRTLIAVLLVLLLLLGGFVWLAVAAFQRWKSSAVDTTARALTAAIETAERTPPAAAVTTEPPAQPATAAEPRPAATSTAPAQAAQIPSLTASENTLADRTPNEAVEPAAASSVQWPALKLGGIVGRGGSGSAILNGQVIGCGESIDGVKLMAITPQGVTLECQGEQRFLKVGGAL